MKLNIFVWLLGLCLFSPLTACSANTLQQTSESRKLQFEQTFSKQCIDTEVRNSVNKAEDTLRFTKPCSCIAKRIASELSKGEMDKFLLEQKITHSLTMSFDKAAYFCVQKVKQPKTKFLFGKKK